MTDSDLGRSYPAPNFGRTAATPNLGRSYPAPNLGRDYPAPNFGRETAIVPDVPVTPIVYLLGPFQFTADQAAPLTSPYTEGGAVGSLTVTDTGNKLSVSGGRLVAAVTAAPTSIASANTFGRVAGRSLLNVIKSNVSRNFVYFESGGRIGFDTQPFIYDNGTAMSGPWTYAGGDAQVCVILRATGAFYLELITGSLYRLLWISSAGAAGGITVIRDWAVGAGGEADNIRVLDLGTYDSRFLTDYGLALNRSTFAAANGTALTAITPEAGGAWTQQSGVFQITSNRLAEVSGAGVMIATVDATADCVLETTVNSGTYVGDHAFCLRYTDANNYWIVILRQADSTMRIYERAAGVSTFRASVTASPALAASTDYRVVVVLEGSTITAYLNNANKVTYASATSNQTATKHGVYAGAWDATVRWDDFILWPRTVTLPAGI